MSTKLSKGQKKKAMKKRKQERENKPTEPNRTEPNTDQQQSSSMYDRLNNCMGLLGLPTYSADNPSRTRGVFDVIQEFDDKLVSTPMTNPLFVTKTNPLLPKGKPKIQNHKKFLKRANSNQVWANQMSESKHESWMLDVYRMRTHDNVQWAANYNRGIYKIMQIRQETGCSETTNSQKFILFKDFLKFNLLLAKRDCLPDSFDYPKFLTLAKDLLQYHFEKADAKQKYGDENVFSKDPSLRRQGEHIYGFSTMAREQEAESYHKDLDEMIEKAINEKNFIGSDMSIFEKIGGNMIWFDFEKGLKVPEGDRLKMGKGRK